MRTIDRGNHVSAPGYEHRCLVIGAGMSGILAVIRLKEAGFTNIVVYEKSDRIGGTWRDNNYPGLRCDIPAHMFTYSFAPNPEYSNRFPVGTEILDYLERVCDQFDVRRHIEFGKVVEQVMFDTDHWQVNMRSSNRENFDFVINATGILHNPSFPDIPGRSEFRGTSFHTSQWNHSIDWSEARVGVIGTGATAVQIVPELAKRAHRLVVFQRSPHWIFPMPNKRYSEQDKERLRRSPSLAKKLYWRYSKIFQWTFGRAVIGNAALLWLFKSFCILHLRRKIADPKLRETITPKHQAGCKRLIFARRYYQALQYSNVTIETNAIERIGDHHVQCAGGVQHEMDVLIYATGFRAHDYMRPMRLIGEGGLSIDKVWKEGAFAYRSTMIPGFPNYFLMFGPYSPIGNYSAIAVAEVQIAYIIRLMKSTLARPGTLVQPKLDATLALLAKMKNGLKKTVWASGCSSWYQDGKGNIPMWPWTFERFEKQMRTVQRDDLRLSTPIEKNS